MQRFVVFDGSLNGCGCFDTQKQAAAHALEESKGSRGESEVMREDESQPAMTAGD